MGSVRAKMQIVFFVFVVVISFVCVIEAYNKAPCDVRARTEYGWVCGLKRWSEDGKIYASFRGVPYAKQPVGELRFKELQPPEPWQEDYDTREEGPVCPQHDDTLGYLTKPEYGMTEACIHANIHVPIHALPEHDNHIRNEKESWSNFRINNKKESILTWLNTAKGSYDWSKVAGKEKENNFYELPRPHGKEDKDIVMYALSKPGSKSGGGNPMPWSIQKRDDDDDENSVRTWADNKDDNDKLNYFWPNYLKEKENIGNKFNKTKDQRLIEDKYLDTWLKDIFRDKPRPDYEEKKKDKRDLNDKNSQDDKEMKDDMENQENKDKVLLPILVFIHGGAFNQGSGDADLLGPEYLVSKDVIVITFNYRINVFGFLSLNTPSIPGNNGLRDQITLLRWVQRNAKYFGGDPDNVTLMGQSAGAACAHLLSLSDAAKGLFKRVILQSGTGYQAFFITSPIYSAAITANFLAILGITPTDPEEIHRILTKIPLERIVQANFLIQAELGLLTFSPVVETRYPGITTVLDKEPETLMAEGKGNEYPLIIGFTTVEAETFRRLLNYERYLSRIEANPALILPGRLILLPIVSSELGEKVKQRCLRDEHDMDGLVMCFSETYFIYQAFRLARMRARMDAASTFLYQFSYESDFNAVQKGLGLKYKGAAHIEDLTFVFRVNSLLEPYSSFPAKNRDDMMKDWMTAFVINFMSCSDPTCNGRSYKSGWPQVTRDHLEYEDINTPYVFKVMRPTHEQRDMIEFYDRLYEMSGTVQEGNKTEVLDKGKEKT